MECIVVVAGGGIGGSGRGTDATARVTPTHVDVYAAHIVTTIT